MSPPRKVTLPPHDPAEFWKLFEDESDRAAAVLGGSYLEGILEQIIRSWMPPENEKVVDDFFNPHGFLGTFGAKKNMAFSLGIVDAEGRRDLQRIANVRNFFAHHVLEANTFEQEPVRQELRAVSFYPFPSEWKDWEWTSELVERWKRFTPREFYLAAVEHLTGWIRHMRVGPGPKSVGHFRESMELALISRADEKFTVDTLAKWGEMPDDELVVPEVIK